MKRIFINTPYSSDANSFWRCMGPMSYLAKHSSHNECESYEIYCPPAGMSFQWDMIAKFDCIFMHRPCRFIDLQMIKMARTLNIPVWSDFDDWLFDLPGWNPNEEAYNQGAVQNIMAMAIACSDVVTVSTEALQKKFSQVNSNVVILPNAYRTDLYPFRSAKTPPRKDLFYWRGTNTHDGDLTSVMDGFKDLSQPTLFMGSPSYQVMSQMNPHRVNKQKHVDTNLYWKMLYDTAAKVLLFPLEDCFFNHCKSNIAWIEAIHAGSVVVAPASDEFTEWKKPGVISYIPRDASSFKEAAEYAMALTSEEVAAINQDAYQYMIKMYGIETINQIRVSLLDSMLSSTFKRNPRDPFQDLTGIWALSMIKGTQSELPRA